MPNKTLIDAIDAKDPDLLNTLCDTPGILETEISNGFPAIQHALATNSYYALRIAAKIKGSKSASLNRAKFPREITTALNNMQDRNVQVIEDTFANLTATQPTTLTAYKNYRNNIGSNHSRTHSNSTFGSLSNSFASAHHMHNNRSCLPGCSIS